MLPNAIARATGFVAVFLTAMAWTPFLYAPLLILTRVAAYQYQVPRDYLFQALNPFFDLRYWFFLSLTVPVVTPLAAMAWGMVQRSRRDTTFRFTWLDGAAMAIPLLFGAAAIVSMRLKRHLVHDGEIFVIGALISGIAIWWCCLMLRIELRRGRYADISLSLLAFFLWVLTLSPVATWLLPLAMFHRHRLSVLAAAAHAFICLVLLGCFAIIGLWKDPGSKRTWLWMAPFALFLGLLAGIALYLLNQQLIAFRFPD